jgi:hypothetical protein
MTIKSYLCIRMRRQLANCSRLQSAQRAEVGQPASQPQHAAALSTHPARRHTGTRRAFIYRRQACCTALAGRPHPSHVALLQPSVGCWPAALWPRPRLGW